jgi:hypothetical protein
MQLDGPAVGRDPDPLVPLQPRWHAREPLQPTITQGKHGIGLDRVVLDPAGDRDDLLHTSYAGVIDRQVHHEVDRRCHGGDHEARPDVLARRHAIGRVHLAVGRQAL